VNLKNKLFLATSALIKSGHIKDRLANAYEYFLTDIESEFISNEELKAMFLSLKSKLHDDNSIKQKVNKLSNKDAEKLAKRIFDMLQITQNQDTKFGPKVIIEKKVEKAITPSFLKK